MNYDGMAYVKNNKIQYYYSDNDVAVVIDDKYNEKFVNLGYTEPFHDTYKIVGTGTKKVYAPNSIPYSKEKFLCFPANNICSINFRTNIIDKTKVFNSQDTLLIKKLFYASIINNISLKSVTLSNINKICNGLFISKNILLKRQPDNFKKFVFHTRIVDKTFTINPQKSFNPIKTNIVDTRKIEIPNVAVYQKLSIVTQKNCFIEFSFDKDSHVANVIGIPEGFEYKNNKIRGVFTKSKEYNFRVIYENGEQEINIIVPAYQRLL